MTFSSRYLILSLCIIIAVAAVCTADGGDDKPPRSDKRFRYRINVKPHQVRTQGELRDNSTRSALMFDCTTRGFPRFRAWYFTKSGDFDSEKNDNEDNLTTKSKFTFRVGLLNLVEFVDTGAVGWQDEAFLKTISLLGKSNDWSNFVTGTKTVGGVTYNTYSTTYSKSGDPVQVVLRIDVTDQLVQLLSNVSFVPNSVKFNVDIKNWNYAAANTKIGVIGFIQSRGVTKEVSNGEVVVGTAEGGFTWNKFVTVTTNSGTSDVNLISSGLLGADGAGGGPNTDSDDDGNDSNEGLRRIIWTVNTTARATSISWDPELLVGVDTSSAMPSQVFYRFLSVLLALALLAIFTFQQ